MQVEISKMNQVIQNDEKMLKNVAKKVKHWDKKLSNRLSFEETWYKNNQGELAESLKGMVTKGIDILEVMKHARKQYLEEQKQEMLAVKQSQEATIKFQDKK